jgi:hypothetical protein
MDSLTLETPVKAPSHVVECSGTDQYAYTLSENTKTFSKTAWNTNTEDDAKEIDAVNAALPENCIKLNNSFTAKFAKSLSKFYLGEKCIIAFDDEKIFPLPDSIFLQRVSPFTKTFDMVCFYAKDYKIFNVVDRKDLDTLREWFPKKIFSCSADPLPLKFVEEFLKTTESDDIYEALFNELFAVEESSASEYEQSSESDEDYESDDVHESSDGEQEVSEYESESDEEDAYAPGKEEESDDDDEDNEEDEEEQPACKKRKMF